MAAHNLVSGGRPVCPVLRPHFVSRRQLTSMAKAAEALYSAMDRMRQMLLSTPALLNRMDLLPGEKMLAGVDPGYPHLAVTSVFGTQLHNGAFRFVHTAGDSPAGIVYNDTLSELFYNTAPVKELRKKHKLSKTQGMKRLMLSLLSAYKASGKQRKKFPCIAVVEFRPPFKHAPSQESELLCEYFRRAGYPSESVTPEQLDYRNGVLSRGDFQIDIVYRKVSAQELLVRFDLMHPLVRAYRDGAACVVNSFRAELVQKKAMYSLLTDETLTAKFPLAERQAIREHLPWTRLVAAGNTTRDNQLIDLPEYVSRHREQLVMSPTGNAADRPTFRGWEMDDAGWDRALKLALRTPYVVQDRSQPVSDQFPVLQGDSVSLRKMEIEVHPHMYLGKVETCSTEVKDASSAFSTLAGMAPTFILESAS
ncbi:MAG: hypothetical protein IT162_23430 [Bryobacterales bacterium]|nr:hypothetical protein [Bryobacterales bacterium]